MVWRTIEQRPQLGLGEGEIALLQGAFGGSNRFDRMGLDGHRTQTARCHRHDPAPHERSELSGHNTRQRARVDPRREPGKPQRPMTGGPSQLKR
jgi:hypothetical protein